MIRAFVGLIFAFLLPTSASAEGYPSDPYVIQFKGTADALSEIDVEKLRATAEQLQQWPNHYVYLCVFDLEEDYARMGTSVDVLKGFDVDGERIWTGDGCPETIRTMHNGNPAHASMFVAIYSERDIDEANNAYIFARSNFVPDTGWSDESDEDGGTRSLFYERWFGDHLHAMGEPSFESTDNLKVFESRFRFSAYPNYLPAYAVRIDEPVRDRFVVYWSVLNGAGGYEPGDVAESGTRRLTSEESKQFTTLIGQAELGSKPMQEASEPDENGRILICLHGTAWVIEHLDKSGRVFLERSFCGYRDETLDALIDFGMGLTDGQLFEANDALREDRFGRK